MIVSWGPQLCIGVPEIDAQHEELFRRIGQLDDALGRGERDEIARMLEFLADYVLVHFETEERWMRRTGYPRRARHVEKHDELIARVHKMICDHDEGGATALLELRVRNALSWLEDHVEEDDVALGKHLSAQRTVTAV